MLPTVVLTITIADMHAVKLSSFQILWLIEHAEREGKLALRWDRKRTKRRDSADE